MTVYLTYGLVDHSFPFGRLYPCPWDLTVKSALWNIHITHRVVYRPADSDGWSRINIWLADWQMVDVSDVIENESIIYLRVAVVYRERYAPYAIDHHHQSPNPTFWAGAKNLSRFTNVWIPWQQRCSVTNGRQNWCLKCKFETFFLQTSSKSWRKMTLNSTELKWSAL